jgi:transcription elongation factor Elf1
MIGIDLIDLPQREVLPPMADVEMHEIRFQCPNCGQDLHQTIGRIKANEHMTCPGCSIGINIDTDRLAKATDEIQKAMDKIPPEITIKFFR